MGQRRFFARMPGFCRDGISRGPRFTKARPSGSCRGVEEGPALARFIGFAVLAFAILVPPAQAQRRYAIEENTVKLGMSTALTGPAAIIGRNMKTGVEAAIAEVNRSGGIRGRKLRLTALDDGYEPVRTVPNMRQLVEKEGILAVIGNVGTPTAVAAIPIANASRTPFVGAFSGADVLRKSPPDRYVINYRASYLEEVTAMVDALIIYGKLKPTEIAFFTERDAYGDAGFAGGIWAMKHHGLKDETAIVHTRYERNTLAVENALSDIMLSTAQPRAVIMVGTYAPCAAFIALAKNNGLKPAFFNVSFVGAEALAEKLGNDGDGVIVSQVVPHFEADLPIVREYINALRLWDPSMVPTFGSLEGYIAMRILRLGMESIQGPLTREAVVDALEGLGEFDVGLGETLRLGPYHHQASSGIWPTVLNGGKVVPFEWQSLATMFRGN
jgi:branched-chain amino acid transport system substrate-binding protein